MVYALQAAGLFYFLTAFLAMRAAAMSGLLDAILGALSPANPAEAAAQMVRRRWLIWGAVLNGWGGAALALRWEGAVPILLLAAVAQWLYLLGYAPHRLDPHDPPDPAGRRSTRNAAVLFTAVCVAAVLALQQGLLMPLAALIEPVRVAAFAAGLVLVGYALRLGRQSGLA